MESHAIVTVKEGASWVTSPRRPDGVAVSGPRTPAAAAGDLVFITDLRVDTVIGIYDWERRVRQTVLIDLDMAVDVARAAATDQIEDTLSYKDVAKRVTEFVRASEFQLVETLAERVAEVVRGEFGVPWVRVRLNKQGALSGAKDVGVVIERGSRG